MKIATYLFLCFFLLFGFRIQGQDLDIETKQLVPFIQALSNFSKHIPQEKVYLHFDNTSYYQGDNIWFKCYVTSGQHRLSVLSKTLYVELLSPGGGIVDSRILKIENGECHGEFTLNQTPFYSGFYEVRAYTKYMLNFKEDIIFSRLLPVFNKPNSEGNYEEKEMLAYGKGNYPVRRAKPEQGKAVNLRFFPEGGNLVQGVTSRVAFEATDKVGTPIAISGTVVDEQGRELTKFDTQHEGKGVFSYTPDVGKRNVVVDYSGKSYRFELPSALPQGVVMTVDNLSSPDSIGITLRKNSDTTDQLFGAAILSGGELQSYLLAHIGAEGVVSFKMDKTQLPSGVSQIVIFDYTGEIVCDRLIFTNRSEVLQISAKNIKQMYAPHEWVEMEFSITDKEANRINSTFSLSVRDGMDEVESRSNIQTDLLLMSEIKGYVRNPSWYFEQEDNTRSAALDLLLMVQGWRRYSWQQMAGIEPFDPKYLPEQGIEVGGRVVSLARQRPQPNVDVSVFLLKKGVENTNDAAFAGSLVTDSFGHFSFMVDTCGKWNMILGVAEKGKPKDHLVLLNRLFSPDPQRYRYADMQLSVAEKDNRRLNDAETSDIFGGESPDTMTDSIANEGSMTERIHALPEVTVSAKRRQVDRSRSTSLAYYDVHSERDDIYDKGVYIGDDIHQMLVNMNKEFEVSFYESLRQAASAPITIYAIAPSDEGGNFRSYDSGNEYIWYKGKKPLFVLNHERLSREDDESQIYRLVRLDAIKSIYINEELSVMMNYAPAEMNSFEVANTYGCAVLIETYPEGEIPVEAAKGIRKTWLEGYSTVKEFYMPDYSTLPPEPDYRRTLYWNPTVTPDADGVARISFYNNSRSKTGFSISAETITPGGWIGRYK